MTILKIMVETCLFFSIATAMVTNTFKAKSTCAGSLLLAYEDHDKNIDVLSIEGDRTSYPNIRRGFPEIRKNTVAYIEVFGDCCWAIYAEREFGGEKQLIYPGEGEVYIDFQPISIKKIECPY